MLDIAVQLMQKWERLNPDDTVDMPALLKNPEVLARGYDEVDRVLGTDLSVLPTYAQVHQVPYVTQILEETLRLWPTAPAFTRRPYEDTVIGDKYRLG